MSQEISLLNTVIGPVMRGPSSSHSAAPYMIGRTARELALSAGDVLNAAEIVFDPAGSFSQVYASQGSDEGFAAGLMELDLMSERYRHVLDRHEQQGDFQFTIKIASLQRNIHPNRVDLHLVITSANGEQRADRFEAVSLGGGVFNITSLNGLPILIDGKCSTLLVEHHGVDHDVIRRVLVDFGTNILDARCGHRLNQYDVASPVPDRAITNILAQPLVSRTRAANARQYVAPNGQVLYTSVEQVFQDLTQESDLASLARRYEAQRLQISVEQVQSYFRVRLRAMFDSVAQGFAAETEHQRMNFLQPSARIFRDTLLPASMNSSFLKNAIAASLAVMEQTSTRGVVCAAPTAGSAGIVPGSLYALSQAGAGDEQLVAALQVMALIGAVFAARASYAAETGGCSVETGTSSAMAAAGLVFYYGGNAQQVFDAAALCLMNTLGLVCDPVGGEIEIPCHARNIAGVSHAWSAAMAVLGGFQAVLPFDELADMTVEIGKQMDADLRCTARGGCAKTPTATQIVRMSRKKQTSARR
ncbi:hypothetical protein R75465_08052 [Paraburkholderia aspalathi]|uniref:L-serine ammonia-lyase, iron-sulfur-dependent, subunit alpha n=1 Tax=Paraburkholderia aspalathi TaxID=1324617 RepID=UPI001B184DB1|nr:L-serine ammonia-lyase, iron-sulfur-dependent, subunit alpha [Paraburkholderia aspalathi]CAE6867367.1 hypothetical protein R75465_08052 [Paraburkholderia aspalathi]